MNIKMNEDFYIFGITLAYLWINFLQKICPMILNFLEGK